jgi:hypothetical protein
MQRSVTGRFAAIVLAALFAALSVVTVSAHEERTVATDYTFVVGFINEPAISEEVNGVWLSVEKAGTPVEGLADTLKVKIIVGDQTRDLAFTPAFEQPGVYEAVFIPTAPGDYTFQITGTIESATIDETFTSSPEGFDSVADRTEFEFPVNANGSVDGNVALPVLVGVLLMASGLFIVLRRRAGSQTGA